MSDKPIIPPQPAAAPTTTTTARPNTEPLKRKLAAAGKRIARQQPAEILFDDKVGPGRPAGSPNRAFSPTPQPPTSAPVVPDRAPAGTYKIIAHSTLATAGRVASAVTGFDVCELTDEELKETVPLLDAVLCHYLPAIENKHSALGAFVITMLGLVGAKYDAVTKAKAAAAEKKAA